MTALYKYSIISCVVIFITETHAMIRGVQKMSRTCYVKIILVFNMLAISKYKCVLLFPILTASKVLYDLCSRVFISTLHMMFSEQNLYIPHRQ